MHITTNTQHNDVNPIAAALNRLEDIARKEPELLRDTYSSVTTLADGLQCQTQEDTWRLTSDMPEAVGGRGEGPTPGMLGRAALGACLTMGYQLQATRLGVELTFLSVTIEADSDDSGLFAPDSDVRPGYSEVRYHVDIVSPASEELVLRVLDQGDSLSPYRDIFSQETSMRRTASIEQSLVD
jgi:uncharacterized OsmC-like protein